MARFGDKSIQCAILSGDDEQLTHGRCLKKEGFKLLENEPQDGEDKEKKRETILWAHQELDKRSLLRRYESRVPVT